MDNALNALCDAIKHVFLQLKPQHQPLSFTLLLGLSQQGKTTLLKQSLMLQYPLDAENGASLFYNDSGVIVELGETWLSANGRLLAHSLRQLNRVNAHIPISGLMLCINSQELLAADAGKIDDIAHAHARLLHRFTRALGQPLSTALFLTHVDTLSGFTEFFHHDQDTKLTQPLGFSLENHGHKKAFIEHFQVKFHHMVESLGQQVIKKLHPARSSIKRTLIREFPLQMNSLRIPLHALLQRLDRQHAKLIAIYFTSAEQGGATMDKLNHKIEHEYALTLHNSNLQANNYRAYFIEGAILAFQKATQKHIRAMTSRQKTTLATLSALAAVGLFWLGIQYVTTNQLLDDASKELLSYEVLSQQPQTSTTALYHLSLADSTLDKLPTSPFTARGIKQLKAAIKNSTHQQLSQHILPLLTEQLERAMTSPEQSPLARYQALKTYLRLTHDTYFSLQDIMHWLDSNWQKATKEPLKPHERLLLQKALSHRQALQSPNTQLISDARNYLNALPSAYLFYAIAKPYCPQKEQALHFEGFDLPSQTLPEYYTKKGFHHLMQQFPQIARQLEADNWVLARQDFSRMQEQLEQAYVYDYKTWWEGITRRAHPKTTQNEEQTRALVQTLTQHDTLNRLIRLIKAHTSPEISEHVDIFNTHIASQFTAFNLMSHSSIHELQLDLNELEKFLTTLQLVNDQGKTVFELTKMRFSGDSAADPLSQLYQHARKLPEPVSLWCKAIADDTWSSFIAQSKQYLNQAWQRDVYTHYSERIANRFPLDANQEKDISLDAFNQFFAPNGELNQFVSLYIKPFLDTSKPQWQPKELNGYKMPISTAMMDEFIRANVISNMFFPDGATQSRIDFSLQKIALDPVVANLQLSIGQTKLTDSQNSDSYTYFSWPASDSRLALYSVDGNHYELDEKGPWAFFRMLQKVNVLVDNDDSSSLQILFEINGNSGRYVLKTNNPINPFSPGILTGLHLEPTVS